MVWQNQGLLGIAFFSATAFLILLALLVLSRREQASGPFRMWLGGWACLTVSGIAELTSLLHGLAETPTISLLGHVLALLCFLGAVLQYVAGNSRLAWHVLPLTSAIVLGVLYLENLAPIKPGHSPWGTAVLGSALALWSGWLLWNAGQRIHGYGVKLLAVTFAGLGLHGIDRPLWQQHSTFLLRAATDHLLSVLLGIALVVMFLEGARSRAEELNDKLRRLTLITTASTQSLRVKDVLDQVLTNLVESLGARHGAVRLLEGEGQNAELVLRASVGFRSEFEKQYGRVPITDPWSQRVLNEQFLLHTLEEEQDLKTRQRLIAANTQQMVTLPLPGKEGPLGIVEVGLAGAIKFQQDEIAYLINVANLVGLTLQNVQLFEQLATVQQQWGYTFDSISDPIFVHDSEFRIVKSNQRFAQLLGRESATLQGRSVSELFARKGGNFERCPYCEGVAGDGDAIDPWLRGHFLASNSTSADPSGRTLGIVHVLKDITDRKRAEEKYRALVASVQEGVFISTPQGRFLDFNQAFLGMVGYESREELMAAEIPSLYVNPLDRDRLKKLLKEHGSVADFEFELRRKDGEVRTVMESSIAVRDAAGNVTAYQGFVLDITERKRAELEIRRRNRELLVLNSIGQTLNESLDLSDSLHRTLRQMAELFRLDTISVFLFEKEGTILRRVAAMGHRSEYARHFPPTPVQGELLQHIQTLRATILSAQGLPLPAIFRDVQRKEGIATTHVVVLWSKERVIGGLVVGSRAPRDFSPADMNLLIAVGGQISNAIERSLMYEETRQAYDDLRRTQEQLLHSEKMAAVGQLISGVAHELNNPLTAILGYSQLLTSSGQVGPQALEYSEKLYRQAQRTHRIVQNLLSFARQHKPERVAVWLNQVVKDTLALRDYDLRVSNVRVHLDLAAELPVTAADPHQLQQVFLNIVNNAVDAILDHATEGDIWVRTAKEGDRLIIEFADSGPGVQDASRVFDPFYTTKPVGKGTGLGLSICYGIITEHGGTIRVRNTAPRGAAFTIELPVLLPERSRVTPLEGSVAASKGARILIVDDDESVLEAVGETLRGKDYAVRTAPSPERARQLLSLETFDVLLADLDLLQGRNGCVLFDWICADRPALAQRVIVMSSAADTPERLESVRQSGCRVLQKPFRAAELTVILEEALSQANSAPVAD